MNIDAQSQFKAEVLQKHINFDEYISYWKGVGLTPLHRPRHQSVKYWEEIKLLLLDVTSESARQNEDFFISLPRIEAFLSSSNFVQPKILMLLLQAYPDTMHDIQERFFRMWTPLTSSQNQRDFWPTYHILKGSRIPTPLHITCYREQISIEAIQLLLEKNSEDVREKDSRGCTPLHILCDNNSFGDAFDLLLEIYPDALREKDCEGDTPISTLIRNDRYDLAQSLLIKYPEVVRKKRDDGSTVLHELCYEGVSKAEVELWLEHYPQAIREKSSYGVTPLHQACLSRASLEIIELLVEKYPEAVREKNLDGHTPLHFACISCRGKAEQKVI